MAGANGGFADTRMMGEDDADGQSLSRYFVYICMILHSTYVRVDYGLILDLYSICTRIDYGLILDLYSICTRVDYGLILDLYTICTRIDYGSY